MSSHQAAGRYARDYISRSAVRWAGSTWLWEITACAPAARVPLSPPAFDLNTCSQTLVFRLSSELEVRPVLFCVGTAKYYLLLRSWVSTWKGYDLRHLTCGSNTKGRKSFSSKFWTYISSSSKVQTIPRGFCRNFMTRKHNTSTDISTKLIRLDRIKLTWTNYRNKQTKQK